jgi:heparanase 1
VEGVFAIGETDEDFICATLDWWPPEKCDYGTCSWGHASLLNLDLENPLLATAIKAFHPLKIRLGGSLQDKVIYDVGKLKQPCHPFVKNASRMFGFSNGCLPMSRWDALNAFFNKTGAVVAFGLNALNGKRWKSNGATDGPWDSSNARDFIQYTVDHGHKIKAWELGNELSGSGVGTSISVEQYAADIIELHGILDGIYKDYEEKPLLIAPDGFFVADWFKEFLNLTGPNIMNVVTHHFYNLGAGVDNDLVEKILNPSYLSQEASTFKGLQAVLQNYGPWSKAWVGETGGAYNSGHNLITNAFVMSFWYLDQLGMASAFSTKSFCRQSLIGGNYGLLNTTTFLPNPDYYSALLWHRLMGTRVLATNSTGTEYLRAYAHCTKSYRGVTLLLINLSRDTGISVQVSTGSGTSTDRNSRLEYHLTAKDGDLHSQTVLLNGNILNITPDGEIPSLSAVTVPANRPILVAPLSIAFVNLPYVQFPACS